MSKLYQRPVQIQLSKALNSSQSGHCATLHAQPISIPACYIELNLRSSQIRTLTGRQEFWKCREQADFTKCEVIQKNFTILSSPSYLRVLIPQIESETSADSIRAAQIESGLRR